MQARWKAASKLSIQESAVGAAGRRGGEGSPIPAEFLQSDQVTVDQVRDISLAPGAEMRRGEPLPLIDLDVTTGPDEAPLLVLRHPSGALSFHTPQTLLAPRRGAAGAAVVYQFRVPMRQAQTAEGRRGLLLDAVKAVLLKVTKPTLDKAVEFVLPKLAALWEEHTWKKKGLAEGWFRVTPVAAGLQLDSAVPDHPEKSLLLIHGTFSNAASAYVGLTKTDFFTKMRATYGDRIYAFNHFTVSKPPEENVRMMLAALPDRRQTFDVITHSRGGLVLRTAVERAADFGADASRFQLGRAVLVASPNDGTPLATPERWDKTVGWIANLLDMIGKFVGENPFISGAEFISEAIVWLAHHAAGDLPGLRAMDGGGATIGDLQSPPAPPDRAYSALVANYQPDQALWQRMIDAGVDQFFGSANDLVVPSEGGWRVDRDGVHHVDASQVGCFGPGGNLAPTESAAVMHVNFFHRSETSTFLQKALLGQDQGLAKVNLDMPLPDRRFIRGGAAMAAAAASAEAAAAAPTAPAPRPSGPAAPTVTSGLVIPSTAAKDTMHLVILQVPTKDGYDKEMAQIFASYGGARVVEPMPLRGEDAGTAWHGIIQIHERIKNFTDKNLGSLPSDKEMLNYGRLLFEMVFRGDVRRLYDTARSVQREDKLTIVFTSMFGWVAEKPWEFAFDPSRKSFLATEEIHFVRNVLTQVPGDETQTITGPLRILVVSAQPIGFGQLSIEQETAVVRSGFDSLISQGLADVDVLPRATVSALHGYLSSGRYNVVHFIGHGTFDDERRTGCLVFEDDKGGSHFLDERSAREVFCGRGISLVFLNACQTGAGSRSDFNKGMAQALVAHGMPALVANQYSVLDVSATSFAQFFYWGLAHGMSLGSAAREARIAVNYSMKGDNIDWAVPVLYARDPNNCLVAKSSRGLPYTAATVQAAGTRGLSTLPHTKKIAIWDVDRVLPDLQQTLDRLNAAQKRFGFQTVDLSVPLDAMETVEENGKRISFLRADRIADRLGGKTIDLHADYLVCITHLPLSDSKNRNFYAWWPQGGKPPVIVLSYAGFEGLQSSGILAQRALTNVLVMAIAGVEAVMEPHDRGPESCPFFRNAARKVEVITGEQKFDEACRGRIPADDLPGFDKMLRLFDGTGSGSTLAARAALKKSARGPKVRKK
jgi:hypothetical protein